MRDSSLAEKLGKSLDELSDERRRGGDDDERHHDGENRRVFVANLAFSATWQDLKDHMRRAGDVLYCDILPEPGTALGSKGCGLVEFATASQARRAIKELSETKIKGRNILVKEDRESNSGSIREIAKGGKGGKGGKGSSGGCRVFVGNLAFSVTWQELKDHVREAGLDVLHCDIMAEPGTTLGSKGCGIVEFASASDARRAIRTLTDSELKGRPIWLREDREENVKGGGKGSGKGGGKGGRYREEAASRDSYRDSFRRGGQREDRRDRHRGGRESRSRSRSRSRRRSDRGGGGGKSARVYVGNLAFSVSWQELKDHMRKVGNVLHVEIMKQRGTTLGSKGCAIVEFNTSAEARRAIRDLTETELKGRPIFVREDRED
eukprot:TRINITY_DN22893_c2_g1_i2.p1 TRINITY_DN22893_c2_g1~~TRINITY_DN22893_c2_g1_i2.p1  ORF type:complete len:378 (-),score=66.96 TRINITY_DN22893_c2_g1_i2:124-1257(-)